MDNRKRATIEDLQKNKWFWLEFETAFNGEGYVSCPAKLESINDDTALFIIFGKSSGIGDIERGQPVRVSLKNIENEGVGIFIPNKKELREHIAQEKEWIEWQKKFIERYAAELKTAPI